MGFDEGEVSAKVGAPGTSHFGNSEVGSGAEESLDVTKVDAGPLVSLAKTDEDFDVDSRIEDGKDVEDEALWVDFRMLDEETLVGFEAVVEDFVEDTVEEGGKAVVEEVTLCEDFRVLIEETFVELEALAEEVVEDTLEEDDTKVEG